MSAYKKGNFVIKNSEGSVAIAGLAAFVNSSNSASVSDASPFEVHMDAGGVPRTVTRNYFEYRMELDLTPGVGGSFATLADLKTAFVLSLKGSQIITSGFDLSDLNWADAVKAIIEDISIQQSQEGLSTLRVTAVKRTDNAGNVIDFTAAWVTT